MSLSTTLQFLLVNYEHSCYFGQLDETTNGFISKVRNRGLTTTYLIKLAET